MAEWHYGVFFSEDNLHAAEAHICCNVEKYVSVNIRACDDNIYNNVQE